MRTCLLSVPIGFDGKLLIPLALTYQQISLQHLKQMTSSVDSDLHNFFSLLYAIEKNH